MLGKYDLIVLKDGRSQCRKLRVYGWAAGLLSLLFLGLIVSNAYLYRFYTDYHRSQKLLIAAEKATQEQKSQILSLASKMKDLEKDLQRVVDFDAKLRVMINMDQSPSQSLASVGGPDARDLSKNNLILYRQELLARKMRGFVDQLATETRLEEVRQQELIQHLRDRSEMLASTPSIWPVEGFVSSEFGSRTSPFTGMRDFHKGLDISGPVGTPIYAPASGEIVFSGQDGSYGLCITMDHGSGLTTQYAHLHRIAVKAGQNLTRGELIGYLGNSGRSTGPHLHYEVRLAGVPVNPARYILN